MASDVLLQGTSLGEPERRAVERIRRSARDMEELTAAFLLLARESEVGLPTETVSINDVVATELERALPLAEGRPVALQVDARCCLSINAPEKVLSVLLGNLLRNAVAYTNAGRVRVEIQADAVVIEDTGVGLPEGRIREMGQPFVRGSTGRPGYGVGDRKAPVRPVRLARRVHEPGRSWDAGPDHVPWGIGHATRELVA